MYYFFRNTNMPLKSQPQKIRTKGKYLMFKLKNVILLIGEQVLMFY